MAEDNKHGFSDPLDAIVNRVKDSQQKTGGMIKAPDYLSNAGTDYSQIPDKVGVRPTEPLLEDTIILDADEDAVTSTPVSTTKVETEVNYGDDDADAELAAIEARENAERQKQLEEARIAREENKPVDLPHQSLDIDEVAADMEHQGTNAEIVGQMVQQVAKMHKLPSGGVPEYDPRRPSEKIELKFPVMGELMACYVSDGPVISKKFEDLILDNWYLDSGITARQYVENGYKELTSDDNANNSTSTVYSEKKGEVEEKKEEEKNPTININVAAKQPVTVNVDESMVAQVKKTKIIDVYVNEVTEESMRASRVYNNNKDDSVITAYDPGLQDIPVTLPMSGYKVIMRPISWFETVSLIAPTAPDMSSVLIKQWSIIYDHIKWTSIGKFKDFDDFMSKTKYVDLQFFLWALLVASSKDECEVTLSCGNPDCKYTLETTYRPREIIHINEDLVPAYYDEVDKAAPGDEAIRVFNRVLNTKRTYELPNTKSIVEFSSPTAKEFLDVKFPRMKDIFTRFYPDTDFNKAFPNIMKALQNGELQGGEFAILFGAASLISAASVKIPETDEEYRYTEWDKIEEIIKKHLDFGDSYILFNNLFPENADIFSTPISFSMTGFKCPVCGRDNTVVPIDDIGEALLFLLSRGYENTKINLIDKPQNS